jgi:hypothetical protein
LNKVATKVYSFSTEVREEFVTALKDGLIIEDIHGFVTCEYDNHWWAACVISTDENKDEVNLSFLHPHGPSPTFSYPRTPDLLSVTFHHILTKIDPMTTTGRVYSLTKNETAEADLKLRMWKP